LLDFLLSSLLNASDPDVQVEISSDTAEVLTQTKHQPQSYSEGFVGLVSSSGHSSGNHAHIQSETGLWVTTEVFNKYFKLDGSKADSKWVTTTEEGHRSRGSRGLDLAYPEGTIIQAINPSFISPNYYDSRSGNWKYIQFPDGHEFVIAHMANPEVKPTPPPKQTVTEKVVEKLDLQGLDFTLPKF
jgi:hypothetical protein